MTSVGAPVAATAATVVEHVVGVVCRSQRDLDGVLDRRAVHERVGVGQADLDDVDAASTIATIASTAPPSTVGKPAGR